jgi:hypothetical protein
MIRQDTEQNIIPILYQLEEHLIEIKRRLEQFQPTLEIIPASKEMQNYTRDSLHQFQSLLTELREPIVIDFPPDRPSDLWRYPACSLELFLEILELLPWECHWNAIQEFIISHSIGFPGHPSVQDILEIYSFDPERSFLIGRLALTSGSKLLSLSTGRDDLIFLKTYISDLLSKWPLYRAEAERDALWLFQDELEKRLDPDNYPRMRHSH